MGDILLELSEKPWYRQAVKSLGLPIPTPTTLRRADGPWVAKPLAGQTVALGAGGTAGMAETIAPWLKSAAAEVRTSKEPGPDAQVAALVFDATGLRHAADLQSLHDFFHPWVGAVASRGRVLILGRPPLADSSVEAATAATALDGFMRSLAKELGNKGATAHLLYVQEGADERAEPLVRFLLSDHSSFLTGQAWHLDARLAAPPEMPDTRPLAGKVALVTGAARGIGNATARAMAAEGAHIICADLPEDDAATQETARQVGGTALGLDVSHPDAPTTIAEKVGKSFDGVDIVVHSAGITRDKTLRKMSSAWWQQTLAVNLEAVLRINSRLLEQGLKDHGRIVCLSSIAGIAGNLGQANYAASKAGLIGYARALAGSVAERGIAVNAIAPGFIETRLTRAMPVVQREAARRLSILSQGGLPQDIADLATFLASPGSYGVTGQVIRACGGMLIGA